MESEFFVLSLYLIMLNFHSHCYPSSLIYCLRNSRQHCRTRIARQHHEGKPEAQKQKHRSERARKLRFIRHPTLTKEQTAIGFQIAPDQTAEPPAKPDMGTSNIHQQIVRKQTVTKMVKLHFDGPLQSLTCSLSISHKPEMPFSMSKDGP